MKTKTYGVTDEQLDMVTRVKNENTGETFYLAQSATDITVTYQIRYNKNYNRLSCTCKGNQNGHTCWHIRAVVVHNRQYHDLKKAEAQAAKRLADQETLQRVVNAQPFQPSEAAVQRDLKRYAPRPFCLLR
jgi:hypothetical protein